ncbi:MAG TPA: hypothetical protein VE033_09840 [Acetobacteraceae bacterium]|nr:hypothetical protein [Acetobacteraceae bacterium]
MPDGTVVADDARIEDAVRKVLGSLAGDLTAMEAALLAELEGLGRTIARAKQEILSLRIEDVTAAHIPGATDELDAIVEHTAQATNEILDSCETLERLTLEGEAAETLQSAITRIYEACSFQDITGQRIGKVVAALKAIEARIASLGERFAGGAPKPAPPAPDQASPAVAEGRRLANGPQLPGGGVSQSDIDALFD